MKLIASLEVVGYEPCPWSVPNMTRYGAAYRTKKSNPHAGVLNLADWQGAVRDQAGLAMNGREPVTGPVSLTMTFMSKLPEGAKEGDLWSAEIKWSPKAKKGAGDWVKVRRKNRSEPDLTNLIKGTEDALEGVIFQNDVQVRQHNTSMIYGSWPGVSLTAFEIEPSDFPVHQELTRG